MKLAKIRGMDSQGMICAQDEIGVGESHEGIMILPSPTPKGTLVKQLLKPYSDLIFDIGLTANRMDAMSHIGVARDVCAWLSHHDKKRAILITPSVNGFKVSDNTLPITVKLENTNACHRYAGVSLCGVTVRESPDWLKNKLKSIGVRSVNNIVDVTNFVLHESGQPLHAFDLDKISHNTIIVKSLPQGTEFTTLDEKVRKLEAEDLMICDGNEKPMCFGGVFGGLDSGVNGSTTNIFLESAWFDPATIRKTSLKHGLRTDAATRFEKGVDISATIFGLKRAALLICELGGGRIASDIIDAYPQPHDRKEITLRNSYLKKLSGKNYDPDAVKNILQNLGFEILKQGVDEISVGVPFNKPDVLLPADVIEEIMRIDGYDNVEIPGAITITPSGEQLAFEQNQAERTANYLVGLGFSEIFTNSITNSRYYSESILANTVRIVNSLSEGLDVLRPSLLESGLERIAYNLNRKNNDLRLFEFGKVYSVLGKEYSESNHLALYSTGSKGGNGWQQKSLKSDLYYLKGLCEQLFIFTGITGINFVPDQMGAVTALVDSEKIATIGMVDDYSLQQFSVKQPVIFATIHWDILLSASKKQKIEYREIAKFPIVNRDLSLIVASRVNYAQVEATAKRAGITKLTSIRLFDVFQSEKLGEGKKSFAINFTFSDHEKTLTDKEIDSMMNKLENSFVTELGAEVRKS